MPPPLALLLCTGFVFYLLRFDRQQSPEVSWASWLPTLWLFSIVTRPIAAWFSSAPGDESGSPLDQGFLLALMGLGLVLLSKRRFDWQGAVKSQPWLIVLLGFLFLSIFWSDIPFTTFKRWTRQLVAVIMAFIVLSEPNPRQAMQSILRRVAYVLVPFSMLLIKYFPDYGVTYGRWSGDSMWVGVSDHKNGLGCVCIIAVLFLVWTFVRRWQGRDMPAGKHHTFAEILVLLLALFLLLKPEGKRSATAIAALGVAIFGYLVLRWLHQRGMRLSVGVVMVIVIVLVGFGIGMPLSGGSIGSGFNEAMGRNPTFTGRADTWAELVPIAMQHPFLGCGFDSYWTPATRDLHEMSNAHCAYLEVFNELGVVGLLLFTLFLLSVARNAHQTLNFDYDWGSFCLCYLLMVMLHAATESSINALNGQLAAALVLLSVTCAPEPASRQAWSDTG